MRKIHFISLFLRDLSNILVYIFLISYPTIGFYSEVFLSLSWFEITTFTTALFFFISLIITFLEYNGIFKKKHYFHLYLALGLILVCLLSIFILFFHLVEIFHYSLDFFVTYDLLFMLILEILLGIFLFFHTYLKFKSDEDKDLLPSKLNLKLIGISILIVLIIMISIILGEYNQDAIYRLYFIPAAVALFFTSSVGSMNAASRNFVVFGAFKEKAGKISMNFKYEVLIFVLSLIVAFVLLYGLIWLSLLG